MHPSLRCIALASALILVPVLAGCTTGPTAGVDPGAATATTAGTPPTAAEPSPDGPRTYPDPPANLTNESAKGVAVAYERAHLLNELAAADHDENGLGGIAGTDATVFRRANGGVYVNVRQGFWFTNERTDTTTTVQLHGDGISNATYYVSTDRVVRVNESYP